MVTQKLLDKANVILFYLIHIKMNFTSSSFVLARFHDIPVSALSAIIVNDRDHSKHS